MTTTLTLAKYEILKRTGCYVGAHVFTWADTNTNWVAFLEQIGQQRAPLDNFLRCACGQYTWTEAKDGKTR